MLFAATLLMLVSTSFPLLLETRLGAGSPSESDRMLFFARLLVLRTGETTGEVGLTRNKSESFGCATPHGPPSEGGKSFGMFLGKRMLRRVLSNAFPPVSAVNGSVICFMSRHSLRISSRASSSSHAVVLTVE